MSTYTAVDEAIIHASPAVVFGALLDECSGVTHWWAPHVVVTSEDGTRFDHVGAKASSVVHSIVTARFTWRISAIEPDRLIAIEYLKGDLEGIGTLTMTPVPEGTLLRYQWDTRTTSLKAAFLAPLVGMGWQHSRVMRAGFAALDAFLAESPAAV